MDVTKSEARVLGKVLPGWSPSLANVISAQVQRTKMHHEDFILHDLVQSLVENALATSIENQLKRQAQLATVKTCLDQMYEVLSMEPRPGPSGPVTRELIKAKMNMLEPPTCPIDRQARRVIPVMTKSALILKRHDPPAPAVVITKIPKVNQQEIVVDKSQPNEDEDLAHILSVATPRQLEPEEQSRRRVVWKEIQVGLDMLERKKEARHRIQRQAQSYLAQLEAQMKTTDGYTWDHLGQVIPLLNTSDNCPEDNNKLILRNIEPPIDTRFASRVKKKAKKHPRTQLAPMTFCPVPEVLNTGVTLTQCQDSLFEGKTVDLTIVERSGPKRVPSRTSRRRRHNHHFVEPLPSSEQASEDKESLRKPQLQLQKSLIPQPQSQRLKPQRLKQLDHESSRNRKALTQRERQPTWDVKVRKIPRIRQKTRLCPIRKQGDKREYQIEYFRQTLRQPRSCP